MVSVHSPRFSKDIYSVLGGKRMSGNLMGDGASILFSCNYYDLEQVSKIAESLQSGLAAACVGNTMGYLFKSPASVAENLRKEMVTYLEQQSEACAARKKMIRYFQHRNYKALESSSECPIHVVDNLIEKFVHGERNIFARVCACINLLEQQKHMKIDYFVYQMEKMGIWGKSEREVLAKELLQIIDLNNGYHCETKFESEKEVQIHRNMCAMRPVNCPFHQVGCMSVITEASIKKHCAQFLQSHVLQFLHDQETSVGDPSQVPRLPNTTWFSLGREYASITIDNFFSGDGPIKGHVSASPLTLARNLEKSSKNGSGDESPSNGGDCNGFQ
ncbi:hypothetical protein KI387_000234, partial [Taxus chinensis]